MPEPPHNNHCLPVKRLKTIIASQREVEDTKGVEILFFKAEVKSTSLFFSS